MDDRASHAGSARHLNNFPLAEPRRRKVKEVSDIWFEKMIERRIEMSLTPFTKPIDIVVEVLDGLID
ncbi:MAG: hypothetical protein J0M01_16840 [Dechloromonas sp.]|nr:hypothetical protein [Dechloromonas sp.]